MLVAASFVVVMLMNFYLNNTVEDIFSTLNADLLQTNNALATHKIGMYLNMPAQAGTRIENRFEDNARYPADKVQKELRRLMRDNVMEGVHLSQISYATETGSYVGYSRDTATGALHLIKNRPSEAGFDLLTYAGKKPDSAILRQDKGYDVLSQPWFMQARTMRTPFWNASMVHSALNSGPVMTFRQPIIDASGAFRGVVSVDIQQQTLSQFLRKMKRGNLDTLFLVNRSGNLVAASGDIPPTVLSLAQHLLHSESAQVDVGKTPVDTGNGKLMLISDVTDEAHLLPLSLVIISPGNYLRSLIAHYSWRNTLGLVAVVTGVLICVIFLLLQLTGPLEEIIHRVYQLGTPHWTRLARGKMFPEIAELATELDKKSESMTALLEANRNQLETDKETGLPTLAGLVNNADIYAQRNMLALLHLSNHSSLSNLLGPEAGLGLVRFVLAQLNAIFPEGMLVARVRSDKLLLIFPPVAGMQQAEVVMSKLQEMLSSSMTASTDAGFILTGHAGCVMENITPQRLDALLLNAGIALHDARKQTSDNHVLMFTQQMYNDGLNRTVMHEQLIHALERNEFSLVMQPIIGLDDSFQCREGECLVRWHSEVLGFVSPDKFIGLAEDTGLIIPLGRWIIENACQELARFIARGAPENFKLHINVSPLELGQANFVAGLAECLKYHRLRPENICIEITETVLMNDKHVALGQLTELRNMGISVALDDFGSGYSSLSYLHMLPFDQLKIDRDFVKDILLNSRSESVIASVLDLARRFKTPLVAEGIETPEMGDKLRAMGCELAQGYFYGRPQAFDSWPVADGEFRLTP